MPPIRHAFAALLFFLLPLPAAAQGAPGSPPGGPPPTVTTEIVREHEITPTTEFIGRVQAIRDFEARARVEGIVEQVAFQEGQSIQAGALLYVIEPAPYEAAVDSAKADLVRAQAQQREADRAFERAQELRSGGNVSQAQLDQAQAARDAAEADVLAAQAKLRQAEVQLGYTRIAAPANGRIGATAVTEGDLVNPATGPLATVVQIDPMRVVFSATDRDVQSVQRQLGIRSPAEAVDRFVPSLRLADGSEYPEKGKVQFLSNRVDPQTGTIPVYADFPNPNGLLLPGQLLTVLIRPARSERQPTVPVAAVQQDREGQYVLVLDDGNRVQQRRIETLGEHEQQLVVTRGLTEGETIIVDGAQKVRPGMTVQPVRATQTAEQPKG